nr:hypothetical protein [Planococcus citreus]
MWNVEIKENNFYFLKLKYHELMDEKTIKHKKFQSGQSGEEEDSVPCFIAIYDKATDLYWGIPISSQVPKYKRIYQQKVEKYGVCDTLVFGEVLGYEKAFLIQNILPVSEEFIARQYVDRFKKGVQVEEELSKELVTKTKKVLALQKKGMKLIFGDVFEMQKKLKELQQEKNN